MRVLIFGGGGIAEGVREAIEVGEDTAIVLEHSDCDVRDAIQVAMSMEKNHPDAVVNCAGVSYPRGGYVEIEEEILTNLYGSIVVARQAMGLPTVLIASVAALQGKPDHVGYAASKAGVISVARSHGAAGYPVYALSPGRVNTPMRDRDYPNDDPQSRVDPFDVGLIARGLLHGNYAPGANVIIRKVGLDRWDIYEEPRWALPSRL